MADSEVMVFGGTGLVGKHLVRELVGDGHRVVGVSRRIAASEGEGIRWVRTDLATPTARRSLPTVASVVSLLPIWMTAELAPTLADLGVGRLVAFSSTSTETKASARDSGERELATRLALAEQSVAALAPGIRTTVLRPTMIYGGRGDRNVERIADQLRRFRLFPLTHGGRGLRQPVHAADLAVAAVQVLECEAAFGRTYAVPGGETISVRNLVARVGVRNNSRPIFLNVPAKPTQVILNWISQAPGVPAIPAGALDRMGMDMVFDDSPASEDFGYSPRPFRPPMYGPV